MRIGGHGIEVDVPPGWEARIFRPPADDGATMPVVHAATVPLPAERGIFGSGVVETLGAEDAFLTLVEYEGDLANTALFAPLGFPVAIDPDAFSPSQQQRWLPGRAGKQFFFTAAGRPFCLYIVIGSMALRGSTVPRVRDMVQGIRLVQPQPRGAV